MSDQRDKFDQDALAYHKSHPAGKISTRLTKPLDTQHDLSVAYSPGVAAPCKIIAGDKDQSFIYTGRGNLVGVITNGSAVLGLGNIGPYAAKPVMEGKAMLFKKYANIDVFDIELDADDPDKFIATVLALEPTLGGINLEDIKAPECFYIEETLREKMSIPVFHDDQHGTAIIAGAAFINALEITNRKIAETKIVFCGAGAAAIACANTFIDMGAKLENIFMTDSNGVIYSGRDKGMNKYKEKFARTTNLRTLEDVLNDCDAFVGVSGADMVNEAMLLAMAPNPIIFALANPDPEVHPDFAKRIRPDAIIATGRSDFPNQVNNVLGFPYIFRGALDVRAKGINEAMKLAAIKAIAELAKEDVPDAVREAYEDDEVYHFGKQYLIPKPVDPRVLLRVAPAVAKAAMETGMARRMIELDKYRDELEVLLGEDKKLMREVKRFIQKKSHGKKPIIAIPRSRDERILRACIQIHDEGLVKVRLINTVKNIEEFAAKMNVPDIQSKVDVFDMSLNPEKMSEYTDLLYQLRHRKGVSASNAQQRVTNPHYLAALMLKNRDVDAVISGVKERYAYSVKPILEVIGTEPGQVLAGIYMIAIEGKLFFFADCTINPDPSAETIADIAIATAELAKKFTDEEIRVAMLSYSSFGNTHHNSPKKMAAAARIAQEKAPHLKVDGEIQADAALNAELQKREFPFCRLNGAANVLIFPNLDAANISYKILTNLSDAVPIGPILIGLKQPAYVLQMGATTEEIINMIYLAAFDSLQ